MCHAGSTSFARLQCSIGESIRERRATPMANDGIPKYDDLLWPTLQALKMGGGSATIQELSEQVASDLELSDEVLDIPHKNGSRSEVDYRAAWARTHLKYVGAAANTSRGVWTITEIGRGIQAENEIRELVRQDRIDRAQRDADGGTRTEPREDSIDVVDQETTDEQDWRDSLLDIVRGISPDAFERLCQRILRESGFTRVEVTGRSGDGGIDGAGVLRLNLISFHVRFQCKRYTGSVSAPEIRGFRGAMVGRADKELFITTGRFTKEAEREAVRDGAPAIDLIDGNDLCDLLKNLELGVSTEAVQVVTPNADFFQSL